jgi:oxygen-independent coproporphyrinogen-3 oxidase
MNYWTFGDYLGIGAGAHGKLTDADGVVVRTQQMREPRRYLAADPGSLTTKPVARTDLPFEFAMNAFRLVDGFADALFAERTGLDAGVLTEALAPLAARGLLERTPGRWRATTKGFRFLNDILVELLPEPENPAPIPAAAL